MTRILAFGDLHLGQGIEGLPPATRLADQEAVLNRIVDLAVEEQVDLCLLAGDSFEKSTPTPEEYRAFARPMQRLAAAEIPTVAITGNGRHDGAMRDAAAPEVVALDMLRVSRRPELMQFGDLFVVTLPWAPASHWVAAHDGGDRDEAHRGIADAVVEVARGLRAQVPDGCPSLLLLHWHVSGASLPNGLPVDELRAPVLPYEELAAMRWTAIVAGDIHRPQLLGNEDSPSPGFYVSSPLPQNFGETEHEHGVWLLDTADPWMPAFCSIPSRPLVNLEPAVDALVEGTWQPPDGLEAAAVKLHYLVTREQHRRIDHAGVKQAIYAAGAVSVKGGPRLVAETRARIEGVDETLGPSDVLAKVLAKLRAAGEISEGRERALLERDARYMQEIGT